MKYKAKKLSKAEVILECCERHPDCSLQEIGDVFEVTKQYVSLIKIADRKQKDASTVSPNT